MIDANRYMDNSLHRLFLFDTFTQRRYYDSSNQNDSKILLTIMRNFLGYVMNPELIVIIYNNTAFIS